MRIIRILKRESPFLIAREVMWRTQREWSKRRILGRLDRPGHVEFRGVPYYNPNLQTLSEHSRALIIAFADEIRAGRYPFLGYGTVELGTHPKWNFDFMSGGAWPNVQLECRECIRHDGSDVKAPYELSRLQFLPILGKAHVLTGSDSYRRAAKDLLSHWIQSNPVPLGVNWTIAMEAALRAMSICFLLNLLSPFRCEEQAWLAMVTPLPRSASALHRGEHRVFSLIDQQSLSKRYRGTLLPLRLPRRQRHGSEAPKIPAANRSRNAKAGLR